MARIGVIAAICLMPACLLMAQQRCGVDSTGTNVVLSGPLELGTNVVTFGGEARTNWPQLADPNALLTNSTVVTIGKDADGGGASGVAIGNTATVFGSYGIGIGKSAGAYIDGIAIGRNAWATNYAMAIGYGARAEAGNSVAIGWDVVNNETNSTRIKGNLNMAGGNVMSAGVMQAASVQITGLSGAGVVPVGGGLQWYSANLPAGFLWQDGTGYHTNSYRSLFDVIGYTFGGSGTNFNVPDMRGVVPIGAGKGFAPTTYSLNSTGGVETVTLTTAQIPSHKHSMFAYPSVGSAGNYKMYWGSGAAQGASDSDVTGGGESHNNMPPFRGVNFIIKY